MTTAFLLDPNWHLIEAHFELEGTEEIFPGFHNPNRNWNGWACPWFTRDVADKIATALDGIRDDKNDRWVFLPDDEREAFPLFNDIEDCTEDDLWEVNGWVMYREDMPDKPTPLYTCDGICWMRTKSESDAEQWATRYAAAMRREILSEMRAGRIPLNVHVIDVQDVPRLPFPTADDNYGPFSRLHDYCDANMLGWDEVGEALREARADEDDAGWEQGDATEISNVAMQRVDRWLSHGGHLWQAEDDDVPWTDEEVPLLFIGGAYYGDDFEYVGLCHGDDPREVKDRTRGMMIKNPAGKFPRHWTVTVAV